MDPSYPTRGFVERRERGSGSMDRLSGQQLAVNS